MSLLLSVLDGRITLKGVLGIGGMGEVHRAWDAALERPVAVKFVRSGDPKEADRLLLEARLQARVEHPNVVHVLDTGTLEGRPCILLQLVEGQTLADLQAGTDWRVKVTLAVQAARGLGAAHRQGLVHRDVKPANILVEASEAGLQALLSDFGLARDEEGGLTRSGLMMGTVDYMAPEQVAGAAPVDFRADIYGLGATLYAVLAGRPPFRPTPGTTAPAYNTRDLLGVTPVGETNPGDLLRRVLEEDPTSLAAEVPGLPKDLAIVVAKAMEKEPTRRYATAEAFADDLERVLRGEAIQARPAGFWERWLRWARRNPMASRSAVLAVIAVMLGATTSTWTALRSRERSQIAAELSAEATHMGELMRAARLMPFHSLARERQRVRQGMDLVRARMVAQGRTAYGPGNYALGLAEHASGRLESAERYLHASWDEGFRSDGLRTELAGVLLQRYQLELKRAEQLYDGTRKEKLLTDLDRRYKVPVQSLMKDIVAGAGQADLLQARLSLVEKRYGDALRLADAALQEDGTLYEAIHLKAAVHYDQGDRQMKAGKPKEAIACFEQAGSFYAQATNFGRSDPELWREEGVRWMATGQSETWLGLPEDQAFQHAEAAFQKSLSLDDQSALTWRYLGRLWLLRVNQRYTSGTPAEAEMAKAMEALTRSESSDPAAASTQASLAAANEIKGALVRQAGGDGLPFMLEALRRIRWAVTLEPENESHREGLANTLGTTLDFLVQHPDQGSALAQEMVVASRWMETAFPDRPNSKIAMVVALLNTITFGQKDPAARMAVYREAQALFEKAQAQAGSNLQLMSDLALAAGTAAETAASKSDPVEPWASWSLLHARTLLAGRAAEPMGLYATVRGWRVKAEAMELSDAEWTQALSEAGSAANLAVSRKLLPREVTFEYARFIATAGLNRPSLVNRQKALHWLKLGRSEFPGEAILAERERELLKQGK